MTKKDFFRKEWEASYKRGENNIRYPQTEVVKFINRFVAKKIDANTTDEIMKRSDDSPLRCLDFACGIGVHSILCEEFGISATGVDISKTAISKAKSNAEERGFEALSKRFSIVDQDDPSLNFVDDSFDFAIAESCLDSMYFEHAQNYFKELIRVTKAKIYFSVIGVNEKYSPVVGDTLVQTAHEYNTIQSFYNYNQIVELIGGHEDCIDYCMESTERTLLPENSVGTRFYVVVDAKELKKYIK